MKVLSIHSMSLAGLIVCLAAAFGAQSATEQGRVAALKQSLEQNKQALKQYEWQEKTVVLLNGEEKSTKQYMSRYGADGRVQKTPVEASPEKKERGLRGRIVEKKKEELTDYMKRAVDLIKLYVPPVPEKIQSAAAAGNVSVTPVEPGRRVRLIFRNYEMPGDSLTIDVAPSNNRFLGANVSTYLDNPKDAVDLVVQFDSLPDGTTYPSTVNLTALAKHITIETTNYGYHRIT